MTTTYSGGRSGGPAISAIDPLLPGNPSGGRLHRLLSDEERAELATSAFVARFKKGDKIYLGGEFAHAVLNIISGIVATYNTGADGNDHIIAFLYPQDLIGLSEEGRYENSAKAVARVTAYALPIRALRRQLSHDATLEFYMIAKLGHELRQAQRHAFLLAEKHVLSKLATFLRLQKHLQLSRGELTDEIYLPIDRSDIARNIGMSLAATSLGFRNLAARRIIRSRDRRHVKILTERHSKASPVLIRLSVRHSDNGRRQNYSSFPTAISGASGCLMPTI